MLRKELLTSKCELKTTRSWDYPSFRIDTNFEGSDIVLFWKQTARAITFSRNEFENLVALEMVIQDKITWLQNQQDLVEMQRIEIIHNVMSSLLSTGIGKERTLLEIEQKLFELRLVSHDLRLELLVVFGMELKYEIRHFLSVNDELVSC